MEEPKEHQVRAYFAIKSLERLLLQNRTMLEEWENSEYCYTEVGKEIIQTLKNIIKEIQEELEVCVQYSTTGVWVSRMR